MKALQAFFLPTTAPKPSIRCSNRVVQFGFRVAPPVPKCCRKFSAARSPSRPRLVVGSSSETMAYAEQSPEELDLEDRVEKAIYRCRFLTLLGVLGSLIGSILCFIKGSTIVAASFKEHFVSGDKMIISLVEAIDVYLLGTVMLVFGMGLHELFVSNLDIADSMGRPKWLVIKSVNELKTKLGHVIVMLLLIGLFDKSRKAAILSPVDLLCFSASVLLCSGCLFLLSKLNGSK